MSDSTNIKLCILWEQELRTASKLLAEAAALPEETDEQKRALGLAQELAYHACEVTLHGLTDEAHLVMLAAASLAGRRP